MSTPHCPDCGTTVTQYKGNVHKWRCRGCIDRIVLGDNKTPHSSPTEVGVSSAADGSRIGGMAAGLADREPLSRDFRGRVILPMHNPADDLRSPG